MIARIAWHALEGRRNRGWRASLREIEGLARAPRSTFAQWQSRAVADHLAWASTVPWFRDRGLRPGTPLGEAPVLRRRDLQESIEALRDPARAPDALRRESSGGSTGEPVSLYQDRDHATWTFATEAFVLAGWGLRPWCRRAYLWGDDRRPTRLPLRERVRERLLATRRLDAFGMGDAEMETFARALERFRPALLQGYASALEVFASFLERRGRHGVRPRVVRSSAEALSPRARARVERAFGCPVRDFYGSRESSGLAAECAAGGFHVLAAGRVVEVVDDRDEPCAPGVPGRVLVTDLRNRAFALVRYENGDVASFAAETAPCPCGCPWPRLERVHGRTSDFLTTPEGHRIHGEWFTHLLYGSRGVQRFQVRQDAPDAVELRTVGPAGEADLAPVLAKMREALGPAVTVTWRRVPEIADTPSGKRRFTVSAVPFLPAGP